MSDQDQDMNFRETIAWRSGWAAAAYNKTRCQNPWTKPEFRVQWQAGWDAWHESSVKS